MQCGDERQRVPWCVEESRTPKLMCRAPAATCARMSASRRRAGSCGTSLRRRARSGSDGRCVCIRGRLGIADGAPFWPHGQVGVAAQVGQPCAGPGCGPVDAPARSPAPPAARRARSMRAHADEADEAGLELAAQDGRGAQIAEVLLVERGVQAVETQVHAGIQRAHPLRYRYGRGGWLCASARVRPLGRPPCRGPSSPSTAKSRPADVRTGLAEPRAREASPKGWCPRS